MKRHLFLLVILALGSTVLGNTLQPEHQKIADLVVDEILHGRTDGVRVVATPFQIDSDTAAEFLWSGGEVEVPEGTAWFALADETPGVLGFHPVTHVFINA